MKKGTWAAPILIALAVLLWGASCQQPTQAATGDEQRVVAEAAAVDVHQTYCVYRESDATYDYFTIKVKNKGTNGTGYFEFYWYVNDSIYCPGGSFSNIAAGETKTITKFKFSKGLAKKIEMYGVKYYVAPDDTRP